MKELIEILKTKCCELYIHIHQLWADLIIHELNMIDEVLDNPNIQNFPSFIKVIFENQFHTWLMWGVNLHVAMDFKEIYLK